MDDEHISVSEAARRLNISRSILSRRLRDGELVAYESPRDRRLTLIRLSDLEAFRLDQPPRRKEFAPAA